MASEGNKDVVPNKELSMEQSSTSGAKRKRGRPRKYEYPICELPQRAEPIQSAPPLHSTQDGSNIRQDGVQVSHTSGDRVDPKMCTVRVFPAQQIQGNRSGRPGNSSNLVKTSDNQAPLYSSAPLQSNSGKDDILGKHFVGKMTTKCPGFSLITVKVKGNQVLRGWVPDENNLCPITPKDDLAPELPMLRPSQVRKRASAIHMQAARPVAIHLEDVTLAKPLQMRRPVDNTIAKHTVPLPPRPSYMGSGVVAAVPLSVSPSNVETTTLTKQGTEPVIPQPSVAVVPLKSVRPVLVSCKQVASQNVLVGEMSVKEFQKDFESSNETKKSSVKAEKPNSPLVDVAVKNSPGERQLLHGQVADAVRESSGQTQHVDTAIMDEIKIGSEVGAQPNSAYSEHQSSKELSDITEQSEQQKIETGVLKGVDGSKSGASDDIHSERDEHEMRDDSK